MKTKSNLVFDSIPQNAVKIQLSENFSIFPDELFAFKDTLEILDLSKNKLSELPNNFNEFKKLKIAFFSENKFEVFPEVLGSCPSLTMVGFKSNRIKYIPENAFPKNLQWLILTDNKIENLPNSIGACSFLQKCALAGNNLNKLPNSLSNCQNLELLRISANQLEDIPNSLFQLPRLSWLAIDGNPFLLKDTLEELRFDHIDYNELIIKSKIGEGASGFIYEASIYKSNKSVAVKTFKGNVTSDGYPKDELENCLLVGRHENIVPLIGPFKNHPESKTGIVMDLIPNSYTTLGLPPNFETCTRDVFSRDLNLSNHQIFEIAKSIASGAYHLHSKGVMHGDLYAHNTLYNIISGHAYLGDFGASTYYKSNSEFAPYYERIDVRAFGCLLDDLINISNEKTTEISLLESIRDQCWDETILNRPDFEEIIKELTRD